MKECSRCTIELDATFDLLNKITQKINGSVFDHTQQQKIASIQNETRRVTKVNKMSSSPCNRLLSCILGVFRLPLA